MVQGKQREVVNIGLGIKQVTVEPRDVTVPQYVESLSHKVRRTRFFIIFFAPRGCGIWDHRTQSPPAPDAPARNLSPSSPRSSCPSWTSAWAKKSSSADSASSWR
jgi:hypothetical protein